MLKRIARSVISAALAFALIHVTLKYTGGSIWTDLGNSQKSLLLLAVLTHGVIIGLAIFRWNLLLKVQHFNFKIWDLTKLSTIGLFFNLTIPGAVGGDLVKMVFLARNAHKRKTEAVLTIVLDRIIGLIGLLLVAGVAVLISLPFLLHLEDKYRFVQISVILSGLFSLTAILGFTAIRWRYKLMNTSFFNLLIRSGKLILPKFMFVAIKKISAALELYRQNTGLIFLTIALSVLIHSCFAFNFFLVSRSLSETTLGLQNYFLAVPIANVVAAIPITPGGLGTRDATIAIFLSSMQVSSKTAGVIPIIITFIIIFWGLLGGILFIFYKSSDQVKALSEFRDHTLALVDNDS